MSARRSVFCGFVLVAACDTPPEVADGAVALRQGVVIAMTPPAANAPVVATLVPGAPFAFGDRYGFVKAPGVGPNMSRFGAANVGTIPRLRSGDVIAVARAGQVSRARLVGVGDDGEVLFLPQASSPFAHGFGRVPWSAWGAAAGAVHGCAATVADEWFDCLETVGEGSWCTDAGDQELDDCASGQGMAVTPDFGGTFHAEFECLLIEPHSITLMDEPMNVGGCDGSFTGTLTYEPGFGGCEEVYNGTWTANDPDCSTGPADLIVLSDLSV